MNVLIIIMNYTYACISKYDTGPVWTSISPQICLCLGVFNLLVSFHLYFLISYFPSKLFVLET